MLREGYGRMITDFRNLRLVIEKGPDANSTSNSTKQNQVYTGESRKKVYPYGSCNLSHLVPINYVNPYLSASASDHDRVSHSPILVVSTAVGEEQTALRWRT